MRDRKSSPSSVSSRNDDAFRRSGGFTLLFVLIAVGTLSLIGIAIIHLSRSHGETSAGLLSSIKAEVLAEGGYNLAITDLVYSKVSSGSGKSRFIVNYGNIRCSIDEDVLTVRIDDEGGKIDLNVANEELIRRLMLGVGVEPAEAAALTQGIIAYRDTRHEIDNSGVMRGHFLSAYQILQIPGVDDRLMEMLSPFITVFSHIPGVDPSRSQPPMLKVLSFQKATTGSPDWAQIPPEFISASVTDTYKLQIRASTREGFSFVREAIVEFMDRKYNRPVLREWTSKPYEASQWRDAVDAGEC